MAKLIGWFVASTSVFLALSAVVACSGETEVAPGETAGSSGSGIEAGGGDVVVEAAPEAAADQAVVDQAIPDHTQADQSQADQSQADQSQPDLVQPDMGLPDKTVPDSPWPDVSVDNSAPLSDAQYAEGSLFDLAIPDSALNDSGATLEGCYECGLADCQEPIGECELDDGCRSMVLCLFNDHCIDGSPPYGIDTNCAMGCLVKSGLGPQDPALQIAMNVAMCLGTECSLSCGMGMGDDSGPPMTDGGSPMTDGGTVSKPDE